MRGSFIRQAYPHSLRVFVGSVFLVAGLAKLASIHTFEVSVGYYEFVPTAFVSMVARAVIIIELLIGILLVIGSWRRFAGIASMMLLLGFLAVACIDLASGRDVACGCFGGIKWLERSTVLRVILNAFLFAFTILIILYDRSEGLQWSKARWVILCVGLATAGLVFASNERSAYIYIDREESQETSLSLPRELLDQVQRNLQTNPSATFLQQNEREITFTELVARSQLTVLFIFTPADCQACLAELPGLVKVIQDIPEVKTLVFGIARHSTRAELQSLARTTGLEIPTYLLETEMKPRLQFINIPTPFILIVTRRGDIKYGWRIVPFAHSDTQQRFYSEVRSHILSAADVISSSKSRAD